MFIYAENFNIEQIAASGQCFRMNRIEENTYSLIAYEKYIELTQRSNDEVELSCREEEFHEIWKYYFDLTYDYNSIVQSLVEGEDDFLKKAAEFGSGIRIVKQEPFEAMISFIISQNKNIPAIKSCIEAICKKYGERKISHECGGKVYYTFPTASTLAQVPIEELRTLKTGYRDKYIIKASEAVSSKAVNLNELICCSFEEAIHTLKSIPGIGDKVANCICLYGLHHIEAFPVDVWIIKVIKEFYNNHFDVKQYPGYAGIIQQYMFFYIRHLSQKNV